MSRFVSGSTTTLHLANGDWLLVRNRLTHGEQVQAYGRLYVTMPDGRRDIEPQRHGDVQVSSYLLDWSLTDDAGRPVVIRDQPIETVMAAINQLDPMDFAEIREAIDAHETAQAAARAEEKKTPAGRSGSGPISPLPFAATGGTSGSPH